MDKKSLDSRSDATAGDTVSSSIGSRSRTGTDADFKPIELGNEDESERQLLTSYNIHQVVESGNFELTKVSRCSYSYFPQPLMLIKSELLILVYL